MVAQRHLGAHQLTILMESLVLPAQNCCRHQEWPTPLAFTWGKVETCGMQREIGEGGGSLQGLGICQTDLAGLTASPGRGHLIEHVGPGRRLVTTRFLCTCAPVPARPPRCWGAPLSQICRTQSSPAMQAVRTAKFKVHGGSMAHDG